MRSIRSQMMLFFSLLILVPIIVSCTNVYYALQNYLMNSYVKQQNQSIGNLASELADWRFDLEELSLELFGDRRVQHFLLRPNTQQTGEQLQRASDFRQALQIYAAARKSDVSIFVARMDGTVYGEGLEAEQKSYILSRLGEARKYAGAPVWENVRELDSIALFRQINNNETDLTRPIGFLFFMIDMSEMEKIIARYTLGSGQQYSLYNTEKTFTIGTDAGMDGSLPFETGSRPEGSGREIVVDGHRYVTFKEQNADWTLVSWISRSDVLQPARELFIGILFIAIVLLIFSVFMVLFLSHRITKPLKMIGRKMKLIGEGLFVFKVPVVRNDEVGEVAAAMNRMSEEIVSLIEKNREEEEKRRLLQLQTLEYQINPHFLYNTLDSVNMLARKHKDPIIADIVTYLSRLFRIGLNQGRELITVADEIRHVTYYLKIQKIRFADQLNWTIETEDGLDAVKIIKFILQPLAENSINHGIRGREEPGGIRIRACKEADQLVLEVADDGVGIPPGKLERIRQSLAEGDENEEKEQGFGLRNVHQRIRLHYGAAYGLELASEEGAGTVVSVKLPLPQAGDGTREPM